MMNRWSVAIGLIDIGGMDTSGTGTSGTGTWRAANKALEPGTLDT